MPIFDEIRARGEVGNAYPLHVGSTAGPTLHMAHVNPNTCYWVIHRFYYIYFLFVFVYTPWCGMFSNTRLRLQFLVSNYFGQSLLYFESIDCYSHATQNISRKLPNNYTLGLAIITNYSSLSEKVYAMYM